MQKQTVAFSKDSANLFFHILTKCNLSCSHCYINPDQHGSNTLDFATIKNWLALFSEKAPRTNLVILGGEPTLHPDLSLVVKEANRLNFKSVTIDTNGYLFHDILDRITPDEIDFISFSLDGATKETNDALRGKGAYDAVLTGAKKAAQKGFSCSMIYTVSGKNIHELPRMPELVRQIGIKRFFIQVIGIRGESSKTADTLQVSKKTWLETIPAVAEKIAAQGTIVTYPKVFLEPEDPFECAGIVADNYFVFPNGRVYTCPLCEDFKLHAYEIRNNRLVPTPKINEQDLFNLSIPEGCVMNRLVQPRNLSFNADGTPEYRIACCMLKQEIFP